MERKNPSPPSKYAVVTGANKGIGLEICRQLASKGVKVVITARDEKRGVEALEKLKPFGISDNLIFHRLDVVDPNSVSSLVDFIGANYGRLDILVNNAGVNGLQIEGDAAIIEELIMIDSNYVFLGANPESVEIKSTGKIIETPEDAEICIGTNYYGAKRMIDQFVPLLQESDSPRIVNVSSLLGNLKLLKNEWAKGVLNDVDRLEESMIDEVLKRFLQDSKNGLLEENCWPTYFSAYKVSKASLNAYTRLMARRNPRILINSVCPGFTRTDITSNFGPLSAEEGAESPVELALMEEDEKRSGLFFFRKELSFF